PEIHNADGHTIILDRFASLAGAGSRASPARARPSRSGRRSPSRVRLPTLRWRARGHETAPRMKPNQGAIMSQRGMTAAAVAMAAAMLGCVAEPAEEMGT